MKTATMAVLSGLAFLTLSAQERPRPVVPGDAIQATHDYDSNPGAIDRMPACSVSPVVVLTNGDVDGFHYTPSDNAVPRSPELTQALAGHPTRGFDQPGLDMNFGTSFRLGCCKLCKAVVQMKVRRVKGQGENDRAYIFFGTTAGLGPVIAYEDLWTGAYANHTERLVTFVVNTNSAELNKLNDIIFNACNGPGATAYLDVIVQDDTAVDYVKMWKFPY